MAQTETEDILWGGGRYRILGQVGRGAMGVVYHAFDTRLQVPVALKTVRTPDPSTLYRLKQEFRVIADLSHPNLLGMHELSVDDGRWFISMEYVRGRELLEVVRPTPRSSGSHELSIDGSLLTFNTATGGTSPGLGLRASNTTDRTAQGSSDDACAKAKQDTLAGVERIASQRRELTADLAALRNALPQLVHGVAALHGNGLLHRDIKPSNIMVTESGRVVLLDFGVSASLADAEGAIVGTPAYMSPEVLRGQKPGASTDWYSVGATVFHALVGIPVSQYRSDAWAASEIAPPRLDALLTGVPDDLVRLCEGLLRPNASERMGYEEVCACLGLSPEEAVARVQRSSEQGEFAGRLESVAALEAALESAKQGTLTAMLISAPSGMGKSALVNHVLGRYEHEAFVLRGRCYANENAPYKGFDAMIDALVHVVDALPDHQRDDVVPPRIAAVATLFPVAERLQRGTESFAEALDPHIARREGFEGIAELLTNLASIRPVICYLDDLQWSDLDSAALATALLNAPRKPPILFIGSHRPDVEEQNALLQAFEVARRDGGSDTDIRRMHLGPLSTVECGAVVDAMAESLLLTPEVRARLIEESGGHPFFLRELVFFRAQNPDISADATLDELVASRARQLAPTARAMLETIAISSKPQQPELLFRVHELGADQALVLHELRVGRLISISTDGGAARVECYHDRVRESVASSMTEDERRARHLQLAYVVESDDSGEFEMLAEHFAAAGVGDKAAVYGREAAAEAMRALAFDRAAILYRKGIEYAVPGSAEYVVMSEKFATALVHAGRNAEAADAYESLSGQTSGVEQRKFVRLGAQYRIASGDIERGLELLSSVMQSAGESIPKTPKKAIGKLLLARLALARRGYKFYYSTPHEIEPSALAAIDACWSAGVTLVWVDNFRSAYFLARCLIRSLDAGEPVRIARALCLESGMVGVKGESAMPRVRRALDRAEAIAAQFESNTYLRILLPLTEANYHFQVSFDYLAGLSSANKAITRLREHADLAYERATSSNYQLWFLYYLGRPRELKARYHAVLRDAEARADEYAINNTLAGLPSFHWIASDESHRAREGCERVYARWERTPSAHMLYYYSMFGIAQVELYEGDAVAAWERTRVLWPRLQRAMLLRIDMIRVPLAHLRARAAIAAAAQMDNPSAALRDVRAMIKVMSGRSAPLKTVMHDLATAAYKAATSDKVQAAYLLERAQQCAEEHELFLFCESARFARGRLMGGAEGAALEATAADAMSARGCAVPEKIAHLFAPLYLPDVRS